MKAGTQLRLRPRLHGRAWRRAERGLAAVELGFLVTPLLLMTFGATEIGRAIYTYNTLDKTVRDGARYLSQHGGGDATVQAASACLAVFGNTGCTGTAVAPGLTTAQVTVCDPVACAGTHAAVATGSGTVNLVSVSINNYSYGSYIAFVFPSLNFNAIACTLRAQLRRQAMHPARAGAKLGANAAPPRVEFALVFALFSMLLLGVMEMGRLMWTWNAAVEATRRGARMAAVCDIGDTDIKVRMIEMLPSLTTSNITITYLAPNLANNACTSADCQSIQVSLSGYTFKPILPFLSLTFTLPPFTTTQRREWMDSTGNTACT